MNTRSVLNICPTDVDKMSVKQRQRLLTTAAQLLQQHELSAVDMRTVHRLLLLRSVAKEYKR